MAGIYNINLEQNATYSETFTWKDGSGNPVVLTGYTASMQIRDANDVILLDVGTAGDLTIPTPSNGSVVVTIPAAVTEAATWRTGKYDLFLINANVSPTYKKKLLKGEVSIDPSETE